MIQSSIANPIHFKNLTGSLPNEENTLHNNLKQGGRMVDKYYQPFQNDSIVLLQFYSDSSTLPTIKSFFGAVEVEEFTPVLDNTITGVDIRYYYSVGISLGADYYGKITSFTINQDGDTLTSEPILVDDFTEEINNGVLKRIDYKNGNTLNGDEPNFFVDWSHLPNPKSMYFFVEGSILKLNDKDKPESMTGAQSVRLISSSLFAGNIFESGNIPAYLAKMIEAVSSLEFFSINDILYTKDEGSTIENVGNSTSVTISLPLIQSNAMGLNVDLLGDIDMSEKEWIKFDLKTSKTSGYSVATPAGYEFHSITIRHGQGSSSNTAHVTCGKTIGGTEYFDSIGGEIFYGVPFVNTPHDRYSSTIYIGISGVGINLDISIQFLRKQPF